MPIPSYRITPGTNRDIIPPISLGAVLRQTSFVARKVESRERASMPHCHAAAPVPNPRSTFLRIYPMNPEPTAAPMQNPKSTFLRIYPMNPEPAAAPARNPESTFSRIIPMNPEPAAALAPNPKFTFSPINPSASQPPAACFMTRMPTPSRQTYGFTRLPRPSNVLRQQRKRLTGALATAPHPPYFPRIHERGTHP